MYVVVMHDLLLHKDLITEIPGDNTSSNAADFFVSV